MSRHECLVWGALAMTLRVSRWGGVAPLRLVREHGGWRASVSRPLALYSYTLLLALHIGTLVGLALDLNLDENQSIIMRTPTSAAIWLIEVFVVTSVVTVGVCGASSRMEQIIDCLNIVQEVQAQTVNKTLKSGTNTKTLVWAILAILFANWYYVEFLSTFLYEACTENKDWRVVVIYSCFFFEFLIMTLLELQFIFIAMLIKSVLKSINDTLNDVIYTVDLQRMPYMSSYLASTGNMNDILVPVHTINIVVDKMHAKNKLKKIDSTTEAEIEEKIRGLIVYFGAVCDVMRRVNHSYGRVMFLIVGSFLLYLVVPPYYFVSFLLSTKKRRMDIVFQAINYIFHFTYIVMGVEPGHRTSLEMDRTQQLVTELLRRVAGTPESLTLELDLFYKQIELNKVTYSPMGICTLSRPLVPTIFCTATTFMVVILQYQALDQQKW